MRQEVYLQPYSTALYPPGTVNGISKRRYALSTFALLLVTIGIIVPVSAYADSFGAVELTCAGCYEFRLTNNRNVAAEHGQTNNPFSSVGDHTQWLGLTGSNGGYALATFTSGSNGRLYLSEHLDKLTFEFGGIVQYVTQSNAGVSPDQVPGLFGGVSRYHMEYSDIGLIYDSDAGTYTLSAIEGTGSILMNSGAVYNIEGKANEHGAVLAITGLSFDPAATVSAVVNGWTMGSVNYGGLNLATGGDFFFNTAYYQRIPGRGSAVPEPATGLLLGASILGLGGRRRKFKRGL